VHGRFVAGGGFDGTVQLADLRTGRKEVLEGHESSVTALVFAMDGKVLVSGSTDGSVRFWDVQSGAAWTSRPDHGPIKQLAVSTDGTHVASVSSDGELHEWNLPGIGRPPSTRNEAEYWVTSLTDASVEDLGKQH